MRIKLSTKKFTCLTILAQIFLIGLFLSFVSCKNEETGDKDKTNSLPKIYKLTGFYTTDIEQIGTLIEYEVSFNDGYHDYMPEGKLTINLHWNGMTLDGETIDKRATATVDITEDMYSGTIYKKVKGSVDVPQAYIGACWLDYIFSFKQNNDDKIIKKGGKKMNL